MTIDAERWAAMEFAMRLLDAIGHDGSAIYPTKGMRIPSELRKWARAVYKHYPEPWWRDNLKKLYEESKTR